MVRKRQRRYGTAVRTWITETDTDERKRNAVNQALVETAGARSFLRPSIPAVLCLRLAISVFNCLPRHGLE